VIPKHGSDIEPAVARRGAQVLTAAESTPGAGDHHGADCSARGSFPKRLGDLIEETWSDRIEHLRSVEGEGEHPVGDGVQQLWHGGRHCFGAHRGELYADAAPSSRSRWYV
jgi:hypothetical protein